MKFLVRIILRLFFKTKILGEDRLSFKSPSIIMPNHVSFLDAIFLYAYLPQEVYFVVNTEVAAKIAFVLRFVRHIKVDPFNPYSLKKIVGVVKEGNSVVLFPEGRISTTGSLMKVYRGIGFIVLKTQATVQPVIFLGLERSKLSRSKERFRSEWFPAVSMFIGCQEQIAAVQGKSFKLQKNAVSNKILSLLQHTMLQAKQQEKYSNIFDRLLAAGKLQGMNRQIVEDIGGKASYRQLIIESYALGEKLRPLLAQSNNVGVLLPNSIGHLVVFLALSYLGKTPAILNFSAGSENNLNCCMTAEVQTILTSRQFIVKGNFTELAAKLASCCKLIYLEDINQQLGIADKAGALGRYLTGQPAGKAGKLILFTSGSESSPKGVVLSHKSILANIAQVSCVVDFTPKDKMLNALPMFHSFGLTVGTLLPVLHGLQVLLYPTPLHYKVIPEISYDRNITILLGTPTFLQGYGKYAHNYDFYSVRLVIAGGEKLKAELQKLWQEKFGLRILEGYGTTETAPVLSLNTPLFFKTGTVGKLLPEIERHIAKVPGIDACGNLFVKGPNLMEGYLLAEKGFVPVAEWYDCGDIVKIDEDGFINICSRLKRFAKFSGEMVSLDAVEKNAEMCFDTDRNAAINLPDSKKGEKIILYTMAKAASKQQLREFMSKAGLSMLAMPAEIIIVDKLPLLGSGKTDYVTLKNWASNEVKQDV